MESYAAMMCVEARPFSALWPPSDTQKTEGAAHLILTQNHIVQGDVGAIALREDERQLKRDE